MGSDWENLKIQLALKGLNYSRPNIYSPRQDFYLITAEVNTAAEMKVLKLSSFQVIHFILVIFHTFRG